MKRILNFLCTVAAVLLLTGAPLPAQSVTGSISGTVTDSSGAAVKGATVSIVLTERNQELRTLTTSGGGYYSASALPVGTYTVTIKASSFSTEEVQGIVLHANDTLTVNRELKPGAESSTITVNASALQLNFENATQAGLISETQIKELVTATRNYEQLVALQPGVSYTGGDQLYVGNTNPVGGNNLVSFSVNGARTSGNNWTVDGADNVDRGSNLNVLTYPSVDAIAEFRTLRGNYSAEYGRSASGQINVITKSGSNKFHGSLYEFVRNDIFNANTVLGKQAVPMAPRAKLRYNDFGGTIGGPVWKDHTFFFYSQEVRRVITQAQIRHVGLPLSSELSGNFGAFQVCVGRDASGNCTTYSNQVTNISPTAAAYIRDIYSKVPLSATSRNFITTQQSAYNQNQQIGRLDHQFGQKLTATFRVINDIIPTEEPGGLFSGSGLPGVNNTKTNAPGQNWLGHVTYTVTPTLLIDGGYAFSYGAITSDPTGLMAKANSPDINPVLPFTSSLARVPTISYTSTGVTNGNLTSYGPYRNYNRNHNIFANVVKTVGNHTLKAGFTWNKYQKTENNAGNNAGTFSFTNAGGGVAGTPAAATPNYVQAFANFLTGWVTTYSQASLDLTPDIRTSQYEIYFQDDWKVTPRLTLNAGMRYSRFNQPTDAKNMLTTFDPTLYVAGKAPTIDTNGLICTTGAPCTGVTANPAYDRLNGMSINGSTSPYGKKVGRTADLNFAPRLGFAYDVLGNGKVALRGGYGIAYDSALFGIYEQNIFQNNPYVNSPSIPNTCLDTPGTCNAAAASFSPFVVRATSPNFKTPYTQQYSLGVQAMTYGGVMLDIGYVGNVSRHLIGLIDINNLQPGAFVAAGVIPGNVVTTTNTPRLNRIRPYQGYNAINTVAPIFMANYNGLQIAGQKNWKNGSLFSANYTWSRALTNANADRTGAPQNNYDLAAEYGRAAADRTHIFNFNFVYHLPFADQQGFTHRLLGGWELSTAGYFQSGLPLTPSTSSLDPGGIGFLGSSAAGGRPDRVGDPNSGAGVGSYLKWFNTAAFATVPTGVYRAGNSRRAVINGPGWWRVDPGLFRNVRIVEGVSLQLRGEFINVFNHTNWDTVGTNISTATTYGQVTGFRDKRIIQLGAKVSF
ncbi:TonB-dependent receptor [Terriglobus tenax]|uniref:TonB-dependent receptor n=1 Tax=Terriglobus tenax TaxID=1111115 RepID=UPI0021E0A225|nr:TonB-dependent receptor [Terriglobus tenax]